jgi:thiol-disulfide isomerase/thioredoxin
MARADLPSRRRSRAKIAAAAVVIATLQGAAWFVYDRVEHDRSRPNPKFEFEAAGGESMPQLALEQSDGNALRSERLRGRPVLLHFWATWCPPCRTELPGLLELGGDPKALRVVAVSLDRDWPILTRYFQGAIPAQVVRDPSGELKRTFGVSTLPATYLLDAAGIARLRFQGARDWRGAAARDTLAAHVKRRW